MNLPVEIAVRRAFLLFLLLFFAAFTPAAGALPAPGGCAAAAARAAGLPTNLLLSVGLVESGRADPVNGQVSPWPWTVNVDGAGHFFDNEAEAAAFVRLAQSSAGDIDVGCFQVSLRYHPEAFSSLDQALDPAANARAAAVFLGQLRARTGSWSGAIAAYHSASPALGLPYQRRVLASWQGLGPLPDGLNFAAAAPPAPDLVVIMQGPQARLVRVFTMDDPVTGGGPRMPRVFTP